LAFVFARAAALAAIVVPSLGLGALFGFSAGTTAFFGVPFLVGWAFLWPAIDALAFDRVENQGAATIVNFGAVASADLRVPEFGQNAIQGLDADTLASFGVPLEILKTLLGKTFDALAAYRIPDLRFVTIDDL